MGSIRIKPAPLSGIIKVPPSKSIAHRAVIAASLSSGTSHIKNVDFSNDILATISGMEALGAKIDAFKDSLTIQGILGNNNQKSSSQTLIDCNESGSTLRFLVPIALAIGGSFEFVGKGNLGKRPLTPYYTIFSKQGILYNSTPKVLKLSVDGALSADVFEIPGDISSQFITGLLFALPLLKNDSVIKTTTPLQSKGYVDLTLQTLADFGISITNHDYESFEIKGSQHYQPHSYTVESDYSQAAFFLCAGALGSDIIVQGLKTDSLQGDKEILAILKQMGADISLTSNTTKATANQLSGVTIDASAIPDIIPMLAATACVAKGQTIIKNAGRLRIKECDRLSAVVQELSALGANIKEDGDSIFIIGVEELQGGCQVQSHADHRIAMMLAIIAQKCNQPIIINDYECVSKSYPEFFTDFKALGGKTDEQYVG